MREPVGGIRKGPAASRQRPTQKGIPPHPSARDRLKQQAAEYVRRRRPTPPLSVDELTSCTEEFLASAAVPARYRSYVAVLLHNEVWRETLAKVPYRRRLLLLPQCLRAAAACPAEVDEFGLLCQGCGRCPIGDLRAEAERLGYVTLIAEGTTVVTSLFTSGKIEAVVGVSCLSVLERVFSYVQAAGIPAIAVPLLRDGCVDTAVDLEWVWEALCLSDRDAAGRLDLEALRAEVRSWFAPAALSAVLGPPRSRTERIAHDWLARGGKRWRPFLAACAFGAIRQDPAERVPDALRRVAVAVECFHKASLVHDDIEDADGSRYGRKTLHVAHGVPVALNVGDFLLGEGYRMIAAGPAGEMLPVAAEGHRKLCLGQGAELCWRRSPRPLTAGEVLDIFRQKTAPAFEVALRLGAVCAAADPAVGKVLADYSEHLGLAYQIRDDISDFLPADGGDAEAMRPSLLLALAYERAEGKARELLEDLWRGRLRLTEPGQARRLAALLADLKVNEAAWSLLQAYERQAVRALNPLENPTLKGLLRRVLFKIFSDVENMEWCREHQAGHAGRRRAGSGSAA